ncbi:unnamed protein product [Bursaphelenchus xylophilus]|uniref:(pine wood nematode) hypothetical protein n=1 Tax=Bursaphelenchus xylophilus TaxID=6326 RepID=A0A1I7SCI8_BURXY|nr:unnamed protein product [Bursaphelenchus xylophilus]CAG9094026.1 unnamed protein product [Bursaphelenchus xylophilus]
MWITQLVVFAFISQSAAFEVELQAVSRKLRPKRGSESGQNAFSSLLQNNYNVRYIGKIQVGTPPQSVQLIFDTGSSVVWVPEHGCRSSGKPHIACKYKEKTYSPEKSKTSVLVMKHGLNVSYSTGKANGDMRRDTLWVGSDSDLHDLRDFYFGSMQKIYNLDYGMLGLAPKRSPASYSYFFDELKRHLPESVFSIHLRSCQSNYCSIGGVIKFGGIDTNNCENDVIWAENLSEKHWTFKVEEMKVGEEVLERDFEAITDSGHSYTQLHPKAFKSLLKAANITKNTSKGPTTYTIPCHNSFNLTVAINGKALDIPSHVFIKKSNGENCELTIMEGSKTVMGQAFLRAVCSHHDYDGNRIGLSMVKGTHSWRGM